ncbi:hypothetical protein ANCDUO_00738 [Ancylostoma duodenale]|uniref:Reverse transcriptase domain-containing protein n=1 Tax=Ancylostoma duodenale TaxID=51022 RepID=A0A0C2H514_9BILA|nr:hypothetical protein ANCDUO_00738 [Ancylostoma duodenale]
MNTKFADVFKPGLGHCTKTKSKLFLKADARPVCRQRRPVPFASQPAVNMEIDRLHPLPIIAEMFTKLNGCQLFSQIDLADAYLQVEVDEDSRELLTINTHRGIFRYNRLPFGVESATGVFQQIIDSMIAGVPGIDAYLDDVWTDPR